MRAVAQLGTAFEVSVIDRPVPTIINATDAIVQINASAICGSDLHSFHQPSGSADLPYLYGHEAIGMVVEVGDAVEYLNIGDYVVIPDNTDPGHFTVAPPSYYPPLGYGGPADGSVLLGVQTEFNRVPHADHSLIPVPANSSTTFETLLDYLFVSDIFSTAWAGVTWSGMENGDTVAVFGAGPVGQLAAYSAQIRGASKVYIVDHDQRRLDLAAKSVGAIPINFNSSDPVEQILALEPGGVRRVVDCVGFEAVNATGQQDSSIVLRQALDVVSSNGGIGVVGLYNDGIMIDYAQAFVKSVTIGGGIALPLDGIAQELIPLIESGRAKPSYIISAVIDIEDAPEYYTRFNNHEETKVVIRLS
ncbi:putative zinc-type alcohol dehydrogenase-like protein YbdR [Colletotrichum siamense]|nr:putative zinc-type alcohol dehydrogenase-like protein YbdR [Colletotrichum siamense]